MFKQVKNWLNGVAPVRNNASNMTASRIDRLTYVIGDIHGCFELLDSLLAAIRKDAADFVQKPRLILLGDYIDRGKGSRQVIDLVASLVAESDRGDFQEVIALIGNHEQTLLQFLQDANFGPPWSEYGGLTTLASYGVKAPFPRHDAEAWEAARLQLKQELPDAHAIFLDGLRLYVQFGDYLFVHAGVKPGIDLEDQSIANLLWIRGEFLAAKRACDYVVVHGHTPEEEASNTPWRIGLDTGAYATGKLTALRLNEADRKFIQVCTAS